ncbi:MAG TPA: uL15 family ribosomal protein [Candidatus Paceibacterota bacterium]|nr:uL15 family ribosomal protein [Candidatus Paceibacterota bacterium]HRZ34306.1 uL15 family ribosomal protein [Candidatus Paceibacterota bacterium]
MKIHQLKRNTELKKPRLIGRGGKRGKTSGRGTKGQKARAGRKLYPEIRDIIKKLPKLRGHGRNYNTSIEIPAQAVSLSQVEAAYKSGEIVSAKTLFEKDLIRKISGKFPPVKIVAGDLKKEVIFVGVSMTKTARKSLKNADKNTKVVPDKEVSKKK